MFVSIDRILLMDIDRNYIETYRNIDRNIYKYRQKYRNITQSIDIEIIYNVDKTIINENRNIIHKYRQKYNL